MAFNRLAEGMGILIRKDAAVILKQAHGVSEAEIKNGIEAIKRIAGTTSLVSLSYKGAPSEEDQAAEIVLAFLGDKPRTK